MQLGKIWPRRFNGLEKTKLEPKFEVSISKNKETGQQCTYQKVWEILLLLSINMYLLRFLDLWEMKLIMSQGQGNLIKGIESWSGAVWSILKDPKQFLWQCFLHTSDFNSWGILKIHNKKHEIINKLFLTECLIAISNHFVSLCVTEKQTYVNKLKSSKGLSG